MTELLCSNLVATVDVQHAVEMYTVLTVFKAIGGRPLSPAETGPTLGLYGRHYTYVHEANLPNSHIMIFDF